MKRKYFFIIVCCGLILLFPPFPKQLSPLSVFRVTEEPAVIVRGTSGSALTVNISFGDTEVEQWISELRAPFPLLLVDMDWVKRFPETTQQIIDKNIPVGLLGNEGIMYEKNTQLFLDQFERFEQTFGEPPLWFRTIDEIFPHSVHLILWEVEVNALGSSITWEDGEPPPFIEGEIIAINHHKENRFNFSELQKLYDSRTFTSVEDVLFGAKVKMKKLPK